MLVIYLPLLLCILGLVAYVVSANPKVQELGRLTFAIGLLVFLWHLGGAALALH